MTTYLGQAKLREYFINKKDATIWKSIFSVERDTGKLLDFNLQLVTDAAEKKLNWLPIPMPDSWNKFLYRELIDTSKLPERVLTGEIKINKVVDMSRLPKMDIDIKKQYEHLIKILPKVVCFQKQIDYKLFLLWCISTWKQESWNATGYLAFLPFDPKRHIGIGKSRCLRIIELLVYRGIEDEMERIRLSNKIEACKKNNVTLTIDETQDTVNKNRTGGIDTFVWLKTTYSGENYRFKALAGTKELPDDVADRCITFYMENHKMIHYKKFKDDFDKLRTELYFYKYYYPKLETHKGFGRRNRTEEVYGNLIAVAKDIGIQYQDIIDYALEDERQKGYGETDTDTSEIIDAIKSIQGNEVRLSGVFKKLGIETQKEKQELGRQLKKLGIKTTKRNYGRMLFKDKNRQILSKGDV